MTYRLEDLPIVVRDALAAGWQAVYWDGESFNVFKLLNDGRHLAAVANAGIPEVPKEFQ